MTTQLTDIAPIFMFGALRSGTTVFRLMLNAHEGLGNPGEADFLFDFLHEDASHPTGWRYDLDVMRAHRIFKAHQLDTPEGCDGLDLLAHMIAQFDARVEGVLNMNVHRHAKRIATLIPKARFLHLVRDPRDVARSSIGMGWAGNSYYGVDHWVETEEGWQEAARILDPAQVLELQFETLMGNLEDELRRVCAFIGVPFSPAMLEYYKASTYGPPDPKIAQQWRRKAKPREIALLEGKAGGMMTACGYARSTDPVLPGLLERLFLSEQNRLLRWRFNINRFGFPLFAANHATRLVGMKKLNARLKERMDVKVIRTLK